MPIDPTIPLGETRAPVQIKTPTEIEQAQANAAQTKQTTDALQLRNEQMRQEAQDRFAMQQMLQETGGDIDKVVMRMMTINPKLALELKEQKAKEAKANYDAIKSGVDAYGARIDRGLQLASYIKDQTTLQEVLPDIREISPEVASYIGPTYDPERMRNVMQMGLSEKERNANLQTGLKELAEGKPTRALAYWLGTARNQDEWDGYMRGQDAVGVPRELQGSMKALFGDYSPSNVQKAKDYVANGPAEKSENPPNTQRDNVLYMGNDPQLKSVKGKVVPADYHPGDGGALKPFYEINGVKVPATDLRPPPSASAQSAAATALPTDDMDAMAQQVYEGKALMSMYPKRSANWYALMSRVNRLAIRDTGKPFDVNREEINYNAAKKFVASLNSNQMLNFRRLTDKVQHTIEEVRNLGDQLKQGSVQKWNEAKRDTMTQLFGNTPYSATANQYMTAVNFLKEEFAQLANGGYAPTAPAWKLADQQINGNFGVKDLHASLAELDRMIGFSTDAIANIGPAFLPGSTEPVAGYDPDAKKMRGQVPVAQLPPDVAAALASPAAAERIKAQKSVTFNVTDKKTGKVVAKWTVYPDGSATKQEVK